MCGRQKQSKCRVIFLIRTCRSRQRVKVDRILLLFIKKLLNTCKTKVSCSILSSTGRVNFVYERIYCKTHKESIKWTKVIQITKTTEKCFIYKTPKYVRNYNKDKNTEVKLLQPSFLHRTIYMSF